MGRNLFVLALLATLAFAGCAKDPHVKRHHESAEDSGPAETANTGAVVHDDSDPPGGGVSGMYVRTDAKTGCQYLSENGLTPRLDRNGRQICNGITQ